MQVYECVLNIPFANLWNRVGISSLVSILFTSEEIAKIWFSILFDWFDVANTRPSRKKEKKGIGISYEKNQENDARESRTKA